MPSQVTMRSLPLLHAVTSHCPFHVQSSHDGHLMENAFLIEIGGFGLRHRLIYIATIFEKRHVSYGT